nr:hypothetical protein [Tanacetum cinerariifolium]
MEVPDDMISDAIKKKAGYKYYMAKKVECEKAKIVDELEDQHVSLIKSKRGKGFMRYGDQVENVPNKLKKDVVPRKTRSLTIAEETVVDELAYFIDKTKGSANETDDTNKFDTDLSDDNLDGDDDDESDAIKKKAGYKYYMAKKVECEKAKIVDELKEQHVSLIKSKRGKGFMRYGDQVENVPNKLKKDVVPRKTRSLTIAEETVVDELA